MRLTVGPLPPAVYWRRRAIVLGGVLVLLFLVAQACMSTAAAPEDTAGGDPAAAVATATGDPAGQPLRPTGPTGAATGGPSPSATRSPPADPPAGAGDPAGELDPADPDACTDQEILVTAETDRRRFPVGASVQFTIRIQNGSERTCRRDIGGDQRELYLRKGSGANKVWSTRDCGGPSGSDVRELEPGFETSHFIVWHGGSSGSCAGEEPAGEPVEPGEYQLVARLGTGFSAPVGIVVTG
jgi:hypothetical protein